MKRITILIVLLTVFFGWSSMAQITTFPYVEDFEAGDGGWVANGGSWALGAPAAPIINSAASGTNAWVTNLTGNYGNSEQGDVQSPVFDFSALNAPSIEFSIWWNSEFSWDGMVLQSSIDGGGSWQVVGGLGDPNNWYNDGTINGNPGGQQLGWTGRNSSGNGSGGWVIARHALNGLAGESNVLLRFAFGSDTSVTDEGVAFDAINIVDVSCPEPFGLMATLTGDISADITWTAGGSETDWEYVLQPQGTGVPTGSGTPTGSNTINLMDLEYDTGYEVYIRADCGAGEFSSWAGPLNFTTSVQTEFTVDCGAGPVTTNYCYANNDDNVFSYTSSDGSPLNLTITSGEIEGAPWDFLVILDSDGVTELYNGEGNDGDLSGLTFQSTGDTIFFSITADGVISCDSGSFPDGVTYTVSCATCINPAATYTVVSDCLNAPQFFIDVDVTSLGDANTVTVSDNQGSADQTVSATGVITFGPYPTATDVIITVSSDDDINCIISSNPLTLEFCLETSVDCDAGPITINYCYENNDGNVFSYTSSDGNPLNLTINSGEIEGAPFDFLVVLDSDGVTELYNGEGNDGDISGLTFQSTGDTIFFSITSDGSVSCASGSFTDGITYTVACATCINPAATYTVVSDCLNAPQFFIDVDVTSLGDAGSVTVSDNQGSADQTVSATGIVTFGPYPTATDVVITVESDDDVNCIINSNPLTLEFCLETSVDCDAGPITINYCYENNDSNVFSYTSSDGNPLNLVINSGEIEGAPFDFLVILDSDGVTELYNDEGNDGDLSGLSFQSTGDTIFFSITSDGSVSCSSGTFADGVTYTVSCATCINPAATYAVIDDCENGDQFLIDVIISSIGDATSVTVTDNQGSPGITVTEAGTVQMGPYPFNTPIVITISNDQDINCVINSQPLSVPACPPDNDNCDGAITVTVNDDGTCNLTSPGTLLAANPSGVPDGTCAGDPDDDVWYVFTALHQNEIISLMNITGSTTNLGHAVYEGTDCGSLTEVYCSDDFASSTPDLIVGNTYFIRVFSNGSNEENTTFDVCVSQAPGNVIVDQTTYTVEELVTDVLINSPCAEVSNITWSTGSNFGDENGIGYFSGNGVGFPFTDGLIMTTGNALSASGPNDVTLSEGDAFIWDGDPDLEAELGLANTNNATVIEFDFIPFASEISFDFLMASEEYNGGSFECTFSDSFAFLLTDLTTGVTTNLAVLPGTNIPISVTNIHLDNTSCAAVNPEYFGGYIPDNLPPIAFDGRTVVFTAYSLVNSGNPYHIKLVIADETDAAFDSGVYLKAGSFELGIPDLGPDITIVAGTAVCEGQSAILDTGIPNVNHDWYYDGFLIEGEDGPMITVTEPGEYTVIVGNDINCTESDSILVEFVPRPEINLAPATLLGCDDSGFTAFNLSDNDASVLNGLDPANFTIMYYLTQEDAENNINPLSSPYTNISNPQTVWVGVTEIATGCTETASFELEVGPAPVANSVPDVTGCDTDGDGLFEYDLTEIESTAVGGQTDVTVSYYETAADANAGTNAIANPSMYATDLDTVYVRVEDSTYGCFNITSLGLTPGTLPITTFPDDVDYEVCPNITTPVIFTAVPVNYTIDEVSISWFYEGNEIAGENGLSLPVLIAGDYEIRVTFDDTGCFDITPLQITERENCIFPEGISPGVSPGQNDTFDLTGFDVTRIEIFNRYGTRVFEANDYTDEWHGQGKNGEELPVGTYFYTVIYQGGQKKSGWVYINK